MQRHWEIFIAYQRLIAKKGMSKGKAKQRIMSEFDISESTARTIIRKLEAVDARSVKNPETEP